MNRMVNETLRDRVARTLWGDDTPGMGVSWDTVPGWVEARYLESADAVLAAFGQWLQEIPADHPAYHGATQVLALLATEEPED